MDELDDYETETEVDPNFPSNVSEVVKLIQERLTKNVYKFKCKENEECPDQDFYLRFNCVQGWFIRCSFKTKVGFLKRCAMQVNDLNLLVTIINTLYTISSKDRIYSLARGNFQAADMKLLPDDNRCLHKATLEKVMANEISWFKTLSNNKQYIFLIKLITFADGLVVMNNIFANFIYVLNNRSLTRKSFANDESRASSLMQDQDEERLMETIQYHFNKMIPAKPTESISNVELYALLLKWRQFITKYAEQIDSPSDLYEEDNFSTKADKGDAAMDIIQRHPIWVTMSIIRQLENLQVMTKVNEYWATTIKEFKAELAARKTLNKDIAALQVQIKTIQFSKDILRKSPEIRDKVTDITKPSFRKKFKLNNTVANSSLISEVYKDYLEDFNQYSKKLQTFPRAIILKKKTKTCNI